MLSCGEVERVLIQKMMMMMGYANMHSTASVLKKVGWRHRAATGLECEKHRTHGGRANERQVAWLSGGGGEMSGYEAEKQRNRRAAEVSRLI
jgi:hypothetical protein